jgi:hypothetical protein
MKLNIWITLLIISFIKPFNGSGDFRSLENLGKCLKVEEIEAMRQLVDRVIVLGPHFPNKYYCDDTVRLYQRHYGELKAEVKKLSDLIKLKCVGKMSRLEIRYISSKLIIEASLLQGFVDNSQGESPFDLVSEAMSQDGKKYPFLQNLFNEELENMLEFIVFSPFSNLKGFEEKQNIIFSISKLRYRLSREIYGTRSVVNYNLRGVRIQSTADSKGLLEWDKALGLVQKKFSTDNDSIFYNRAIETMAITAMSIFQTQEKYNEYIRFLPLNFVWNFKKENMGESYTCLALLNFRRMTKLMDKYLEEERKTDFLLQRFRYSVDTLLTYWKNYFTFSDKRYFNILEREMTNQNSIHKLTSGRVEYFYPYDEVVAQRLDFLHLLSLPKFLKTILDGKNVFEVVSSIVVKSALDFFYKQIFPVEVSQNNVEDATAIFDFVEELIPPEKVIRFSIFKIWFVHRQHSFELENMSSFRINLIEGRLGELLSLISFGENLILFMEFCLRGNQYFKKNLESFGCGCKYLEMGINVFWGVAKELEVRPDPRISAITVILTNLINEISSPRKGIHLY